jgi:hypothetical protein
LRQEERGGVTVIGDAQGDFEDRQRHEGCDDSEGSEEPESFF